MIMLSPLVIMLGGNQENTASVMQVAVLELSQKVGKLVYESKLYLSEPWGFHDQPPFLNKAIVLESLMAPDAVLEVCKSLEASMGRTESILNGPRLIDIDIMFYGNLVMDSSLLTIPHPRMHLRKFNLVPLSEIIPEWVHPVLGKTISELLDFCPDELEIKILYK